MDLAPCFEGISRLRSAVLALVSGELPRGSATQPPVAVDAGLLRVWRERAASIKLGSGDPGIAKEICSFVDEVGPPAFISPRTFVHLKLRALAADVSGELVLVGAPEEELELLVWDWRKGVSHMVSKTVRGLIALPSCVWLDLAVDRVAAGCFTGAVQIWSYSTGTLLANCVPQVLESTRWTTVGHNSEILSLAKAPPSADGVPSTTTTLSSGDGSGVACVWSDEGHPAICVHTTFELRRLKLGSHAIVGLATAPGVLLCCLCEAVIGFEAPGGYPLFVLSSRQVPVYPELRVGRLLALAVITDEMDADPEKPRSIQVLAATIHGAIVMWKTETHGCGAAGSRDHIKRPSLEPIRCSVVASPYAGQKGAPPVLRNDDSRATRCWHGAGTVSSDTLCWVCQVTANEAVVRWTDLGHLGPDCKPPMILEGAVRKNLEGWLCIAPRRSMS